MSTNQRGAEVNIRDFVQKHGEVGFLKLLLTNYIFELVRHHVDRLELASPEQIERFRQELHSECSRRADLIANKLGKELPDKLTEEFIRNLTVARLVDQALESTIEET